MIVNIFTHCECYTYGDVSYEGWNFVWHAAQLHCKCHILYRDKIHVGLFHIENFLAVTDMLSHSYWI